MKRKLMAFLSFAVCLGCFSDYSQAQTRTTSEVVEILKQYDEAWNKKDVAGVSKFLADGYVYFTSAGGTSDRKATLEFLAMPSYKLTFVERSEIVLHSYDGKIAALSSRWKGRGTYGKEEINDDQRCGLVFVRQSKQWRLLSEHCVQIVSK